MTKSIDHLTAWYQAWLVEQRLPPLSAEDLMAGDLTDRQRIIVSNFYLLWEQLEAERIDAIFGEDPPEELT